MTEAREEKGGIFGKLDRFRKRTLEYEEISNCRELGAGGQLGNLNFEEGATFQSECVARPFSSFIGAYSYVNPGGYIRSNVFIMRFCSIGRRVSIGAANHIMEGISTHPQLMSLRRQRPDSGIKYTIIENDVWIGDGAVIMEGVRVGMGAVIAANAVVTKDVAPFNIAGGIPARLIRRRLPDDVCTQLLETEYFEYALADVKSLSFHNPVSFIREASAANLERKEYSTYRIKRP